MIGGPKVHNRAKLTWVKVRWIRHLRALNSKTWTYRALSKKYGVEMTAISKICRGESWVTKTMREQRMIGGIGAEVYRPGQHHGFVFLSAREWRGRNRSSHDHRDFERKPENGGCPPLENLSVRPRGAAVRAVDIDSVNPTHSEVANHV